MPAKATEHDARAQNDAPDISSRGNVVHASQRDSLMQSLQRQLENILSYVSATAVAFMMLITVADVVVRYATPFSVPGSYAFVSLSFVFVIYLGLSVAQRENSHIAIDALYDKLGRGQRKILQIILLGLFSAFFGALTWYSAVTVWENYQFNDTILGAIQVVTWPARVMIPIGFLFLTLRMLVQLYAIFARDELIEEGVEAAPQAEEA